MVCDNLRQMNQTIAVESDITNARGRLNKRLGVLYALVVMTAIATLPFFVIGEDQKVGCCGGEMPVTHDSWMHLNQMRAFYRGLESGRLYPRWDDETHGGYGAPTLAFYPPGAYYVTSFFYFLTRDWSKVWIGFYWLASFASAAAIYCYARRMMSRGASLVVAAVYVFAPYHLINQYQRGAMAEFLSFVWTPLVLLFAERLLAKSSRRELLLSFAGLSASFGAFLWSHPPTAYQFMLVFGPCFVVWAIWMKRRRELLIIGCALAFGSMIAAAYFFPAVAEQSLVNYDDVELTWPYHASYLYDFGQKVYDRVGDSFFIRLDRIWAFNALAILLLGGAVMNWAHKSSESYKSHLDPIHDSDPRKRVWLWASAGLIACFLMTKYSEPIGRLIPKIEIGVYSWRMMTLTSFAVAMLAGACFEAYRGGGACLPWLRKSQIQGRHAGLPLRWGAPKVLSLAASLMILIAALAMSAWYVAWPMWRGQSFEPNPEHYNYATLPRGVPRETPPMDRARLASGNGRVTIDYWAPELRNLRVEMEKPDQLQFRTSNFAGWTATIDGKLVEIKEGAVKNVIIDAPAGEHAVALEFRPTPVRRVGNVITILSLTLLFSAIIATIRLKRA
jgi:6-pyruvoyl-tetrahydropterin synthase related domain